ncbi:MAG: hypothetical protein J6S77_05295 [Clostridia bacterium]|nr:hypothetical protein [Clostridia bacterium]
MKKLFIILLSCLLLVSCAGGEIQNVSGDVSENVSGVEKEESALPLDPLEVLPDGHFEGAETVIWTTDLSVADPNYAYDTALKKIMQERIDSIENKFDTTIVIVKKTAAEIKSALQSGENCPDIVIMPSKDGATASVNGQLTNMWSLPYFSEAAKALGGDAEEQTINNSLFMLTGTFNFTQQNSLVVYANRDLIKSKGMRDPAYSVDDGTWTVDKMFEYINAISTVAGKPTGDLEKDIFGYTAVGLDTKSLTNVFWNGSGIKYFGETMGKPLKAEFDYELGKQATNAVKKLMESSTKLTESSSLNTKQAFLDQKVLFCVTYFNQFLGENKIEGFDWEILPLPKTSAEQESYYSPVTEALCVAVPKANEDSYSAGLVLSAWILASREIEPTLHRYYITHNSSDNANTVMMYEVFNTVHYPLTELYSSIYNINSVGRELIATSVTDNIDLGKYIRWQDAQMEQTAEKFK